MPIYNFKCTSCPRHFNAVLTIDMRDIVVPVCPTCRSTESVERIPTAANFKVEGHNAGNGYSK